MKIGEVQIKMKKIFVYGSLRKDCYNFALMNKALFQCDDIIKGYDMFSLGAYPCISKGKGRVLGEIYLIPEELYQFINLMETGAGYVRKKIKTEFDNEVYVWIYDNLPFNPIKVIHGDWVRWEKEMN